jgi:tetratricopeptide (TPR) repeat protein
MYSCLALAGVIAGIVFIRAQPLSHLSEKSDDDYHALWVDEQYAKIIEISEEVLSEDPLDLTSLVLNGFANFYLGTEQFSLEDKIPLFDEAILSLRKALVIGAGPFYGKVQYTLGKAYFHKGKYYLDLAILYLEESLKKGYTGEDTFKYLGLIYSELGNYERGVEFFQKAVGDNPSDILYLTLAQSYYQLEDYEKAEEYLIKTLNRRPDFTIEQKSRFLLGRIYLDQDEYLKAEDQYSLILKINPQSADAHYYLGEIFNKLNDIFNARAEWRKAWEIDPNHHGALLRLY